MSNPFFQIVSLLSVGYNKSVTIKKFLWRNSPQMSGLQKRISCWHVFSGWQNSGRSDLQNWKRGWCDRVWWEQDLTGVWQLLDYFHPHLHYSTKLRFHKVRENSDKHQPEHDTLCGSHLEINASLMIMIIATNYNEKYYTQHGWWLSSESFLWNWNFERIDIIPAG